MTVTVGLIAAPSAAVIAPTLTVYLSSAVSVTFCVSAVSLPVTVNVPAAS